MKKRIDVLDGLRGIAVLMVFLSHTAARDSALASFLDFKGIGHIGVYLFFTLSAFLLGLGVFSKPLDSNNIKAFFIKRTLRIIPLYYIVVSGVFLFQRYNQSYSPRYLHIDEGLKGYLQHLIFYRGDGVFWSIVSEMQFYLLVPLIAFILIKFERKGVIFLGIIAFFNFVIYLAKYAGLSDIILYFSPNTLERGTFIDIFLPGIILSYYLRKKREVIEQYEPKIHRAANYLFIGGGLITLILVSNNFLGFNQPFYEFRFFSLLFGLAFSTITLSLYLGNPLMNNFFSSGLLRFIGRVGFTYYLIHMGVFEALNQTELSPQVKFFLSFGIISGISWISFMIIEKPSIKLAYRLIDKLKLRSA